MTPRRRNGFTLVELVLVGSLVVILLVILLPYVGQLREGSQRAACQGRLRLVRDGLFRYAAENDNAYPRTPYAAGTDGYVAYTGATDSDPFRPGTGAQVQPNDVTASLWLLVRGAQVPGTEVFVCPSTWDTPDPLRVAARQRGNFAGPEHLSYSYAMPFSSMANYRLDDTLVSSFALLADLNPAAGGDDGVVRVGYQAPPLELSAVNSPNHNRAGQNVLFSDGSVRWATTPYVGAGNDGADGTGTGDNIYTALAPEPLRQGEQPPANAPGYDGPTVGPAYQYDAYLVPDARD